jgi:hypothetical protein
VNPPANAYETYGYQESAVWTEGGASAAERAVARPRPPKPTPKPLRSYIVVGPTGGKEKTRVMDVDSFECPPGQSVVNGECFAAPAAQPSCPPGWVYRDDGQCHRADSRKESYGMRKESYGMTSKRKEGMDAAQEGVTKKECPPYWEMRNGQCVSRGQPQMN